MKLHRVKECLNVHDCDISGSVYDDVNMSGSTVGNVNLAGCTFKNVNIKSRCRRRACPGDPER
jgi:uncharacterized protein YjbI with pentapeptide repeats